MALRKNRLAWSISHALWMGAFTAGAASAADTPQDGRQADDQVITVTAQSRAQQAQAVPISLQMVTSDQLGKLEANNLAEVNGYIPGLVVNADQPTQPGYSIRGIGTSDFGIGTDSPVGIYVDGVYTGKTGGALMNFNDVQRVEVIKGPQGTLFGRNSAAGAISVITKEPGADFDADAHVRLGQYGERYVDALLNLPINDNLAARITFVDHKTDGWLTDAATGQKLNAQSDWGMRAQIKWESGKTKAILSWEHENLDQDASVAIGIVPVPPPGMVPPFPANPAAYINPLTAPVYNDVQGDRETRDFDGVTLRFETPLSFATFNSTTAYRHFNSGNLEGNNGTNSILTYLDTNNIENNSTWQQEFKLSGKNDMVDWVGGISFFGETAHQTSQVDTYTDTLSTLSNNLYGLPLYAQLQQAAGLFGLPVNLLGNSWQESMINKGSYRSEAIYGDTIWHLSPQLDLTAGVRFSRDSKDFSWYNPPRSAPGLDAAIGALNQANFFPTLVGAGLLSQAQADAAQAAMTQNIEFNNAAATAGPVAMSTSWSDVSPRLVLDYKLTPDIMLFGSATKGYQSGGFNALSVAGKYDPETVRNFEIGIKSNFRDQHLLLNASLFNYKFSNLQALNLVQNASPIPSYQVTSSDQVATGVDFEANWRPVRDLKMSFSSEYIDQTFHNYVNPEGVNLSNQPVGTPLWSAAAMLDYTIRKVSNGSLDLVLGQTYIGATRCNDASAFQGTCLTTRTFSVGAAQSRTDVRAGWEADSHKWGLAFYIRNLFDHQYIDNIGNTSATTLGTPYASITAPRMVGVEAHIGL
ncbi:MAG TPA: TonB-dependent receptor [Burkholderiaceae bacterium]